MPQNPQTDEKASESIRVRPEDAPRIVKLVEHFQKNSIGPVYKNLVVKEAIDALYEKIGWPVEAA